MEKAACPKCRGATVHNEMRGDMYCIKCGDKNAVTLKKAVLNFKN